MNNILLVGLGGFIGAILRYTVSTYVQMWTEQEHTGFPYGTLTVNIVGCLLIGIGSQLAANHQWFTPELP